MAVMLIRLMLRRESLWSDFLILQEFLKDVINIWELLDYIPDQDSFHTKKWFYLFWRKKTKKYETLQSCGVSSWLFFAIHREDHSWTVISSSVKSLNYSVKVESRFSMKVFFMNISEKYDSSSYETCKNVIFYRT